MDVKRANKSLVLRLALVAVGMFGFGFAMVPLYDIFCEITGIRIPIEASLEKDIKETAIPGREITMELLASTNNGAPWEFHPVNDTLKIYTGKLENTQFFARNLSDAPLIGVATPDVRPAEAARYLRKVECFCFNEQHFAAGEARKLDVRFYIEPDLPAHINTITLAYTLFAAPEKLADTNE